MADQKTIATVYLHGEGRSSLDECMGATFAHCRVSDVNTIVIYTATGEGPCQAIERFSQDPEYAQIRIVAVTPPAQKAYAADPRKPDQPIVRAGIVGERRRQLHHAGVPIVSGRLPFRPVVSGAGLADPTQAVDAAFGVLGGGFSLCIQAALLACDAGAVSAGERVASMSADTSLVLLASYTESFLSPTQGLLVEHIICRPSLYDISKPDHVATRQAIEKEEQSFGEQALLEAGDEE